LRLEVEAQGQPVHVLEGLEREFAHACIATLAKRPSRTWVSSAMAIRARP
jgi:hypothetical protein